MNNSTKLLLPALVLALFAVPTFARGGGNGNGGGGNGAQQRTQTPSTQCDGSGPRSGNPAICDGSGPGQGTPRRDGSGKALNNRGNPQLHRHPAARRLRTDHRPRQWPEGWLGQQSRLPAPRRLLNQSPSRSHGSSTQR